MSPLPDTRPCARPVPRLPKGWTRPRPDILSWRSERPTIILGVDLYLAPHGFVRSHDVRGWRPGQSMEPLPLEASEVEVALVELRKVLAYIAAGGR